jgi:photosystem II stability/assembly factor-like uncharacterized protein
VADPVDPLAVYAGTDGGLEKSADGDATWNLIHGTEPVVAFAVAPSAPRVLYLAGAGVLQLPGIAPLSRSDDGGATWQALAPGLSGIDSISVDPTDARSVYVTGSYFHVDASPGFLHSADGGATWSAIPLQDFVTSLVIDPRQPTTLYAVTPEAGIVRSRDRGATWEPVAGLPPARQIQANSLALDPATGVLYVALFFFGADQDTSQIWKSPDGGASWARVLESGEAIQTVAVDSGLAGRIYAGTYGAGILVSADAGGHWQLGNSGIEAQGVDDLTPDPHAAGTLYIVPHLALGVEKTADGGATWTPAGQGLAGDVRRVAADPRIPGRLYAATRADVFKSSDAGLSWQATGSLPMIDVLDVQVDPLHPEVVFAAGIGTQYSIDVVARSVDGGAAWQVVFDVAPPGTSLGAAGFMALLPDAAVPGTLFAGGRAGVWKSSDGGGSWTPASTGLPRDQVVTGLRSDTAHNLYAVLDSGVAANGGGASAGNTLFRSADGGATWSALDAGFPAGTFARDLLADPRGTALYAATNAGVLVSADGGSHWAAQNDGLSELRVNRLAADPAHPGVFFAGTVAGLFVSPPPARACAPIDTVLCLAGRCFAVEVSWSLRDGTTGKGHSEALAANTGTFWFFQPASIELTVKIVDGTPVNGHFWVFYGALSDVGYVLTVTDTSTGVRRTYTNPAGSLASAADTSAFAGSPPGIAAEPPGAANVHEQATGKAGAACTPASETLCLQSSRFEVAVAWRLPGTGDTPALSVPLSQDTGAFWFFSPESLELVVKVIDGRDVNGHFWVFIGGLSDVAYAVTVTDTVSGASMTYRNHPGELRSRADTNFPTGR